MNTVKSTASNGGSTQVAIIDYGMGNLHSVASAVKNIAPQVDVIVTSDSDAIARADRVIFPGVGAIRDCVAEIKRRGFDRAMENEIASGKPVLAICVGLQALMQHSEENDGVDCLQAFEGAVKGFSSTPAFQQASQASDESLKVPHMGWNRVSQVQEHALWHGIEDDSRFYFVHSYYIDAQSTNTASIAGTCQYGVDFVAALAQKNVFAAQFHPEKSHTNGLQLLKNFVAWNGLHA